MTPNRVTVSIEKYGDQIPKQYLSPFRTALVGASNDCLDTFMWLKIRNKNVTLLLSLFFGRLGADRFYIGSKKAGFGKLALTLIQLIFMSSVEWLGIVAAVASSIWCIADLFYTYKTTKLKNYHTLYYFLINHKATAVSSKSSAQATIDSAAGTYDPSKNRPVAAAAPSGYNPSANISNNPYNKNKSTKASVAKPGKAAPAKAPVAVAPAKAAAPVKSAAPSKVKAAPAVAPVAEVKPEPPRKTNLFYDCPICKKNMHITVVKDKYTCPTCLRTIFYEDVVDPDDPNVYKKAVS